jgi:hypothetical protein
MDDSVSSGLPAIDSTNLVRDWLVHFSSGVAFMDTTKRDADGQHDAVLGEDGESCRDHGSGWALANRMGH